MMEIETGTRPPEAPRTDPPASDGSCGEMPFLALLRGGARPLGSMVRDFNLHPIRYAHPSWIPEGWDRVKEASGRMGGRPELRMSVKLLLHWDFTDEANFAFGAASRRIALAEPSVLDRTAFLAGVAVHWESISKILERESVLEMRREIGNVAYSFALLRAPILAGNPPATKGIAVGERDFAGVAGEMRRIGVGLVSACMDGAPRSLRARLALKFPREYSELFLTDRPGPVNARIWRLVKGILIQEVDASWEPLLS